MEEFKRPKMHNYRGIKSAIQLIRLSALTAGIFGTVTGLVLYAKGKPTLLVNSIYAGNMANMAGWVLESALPVPKEKAQQLEEYIDAAITRINDGAVNASFPELDGDETFIAIEKVSDGNPETLNLHLSVPTKVREDANSDIGALKMQVFEALLIVNYIDAVTPEFEILVHLNGHDHAYKPTDTNSIFFHMLVELDKATRPAVQPVPHNGILNTQRGQTATR